MRNVPITKSRDGRKPTEKRIEMVNRETLDDYERPFIHSGCTLLNLALGGGWGRDRIINVVGDRSTGKTGLAIEACANFAREYGAGGIRYLEAESAFDENYAATVGLPKDLKIKSGIATVENFYGDLLEFLDQKPEGPALYVLDSLDALSDDDEMGRGIGSATYGTSKARKLSEIFRRATEPLARKQCTLMIISQVRDNIGVTFGETKTRSGGRALDFYASQIVWLSELGKIKRTFHGVERTTGIRVRARVRKNKLGMPHREAEFPLIFNYGIDDEVSMLDWLSKNKLKSTEEIAASFKALGKAREKGDRPAVQAMRAEWAQRVLDAWTDVEAALAPPMPKYA